MIIKLDSIFGGGVHRGSESVVDLVGRIEDEKRGQ